MTPADPLPTDEQRKRLCQMMAHAFVEIRSLGWAGNAQQAADLADAFHNLPQEIYGWGRWTREGFRGMLSVYEQKYPDRTGFYTRSFDAIFGQQGIAE